MSRPRTRLGLVISAACLLAAPACRKPTGSAAAGAGSGSAASRPAPPPPLDTSWQRESSRLLAAGETAPDFEGIAHTGMRVRLSRFLEKPAVVVFYDADGSAAAQALVRELRDGWLTMTPRIGMVLGVSTNDRVTHRDFATAEELPFLLVADDSTKIARAFGVPLRDGRADVVMFVIGKDRKILRVLPGAPPGTVVESVLSATP